ncbi:hypothetical protein GQ53DRAFT_775839 [Thozetella sp. PMI_491]|nr:hypothetical protein GQ53DRAFT_775839 [Thozetella sp. PMI_491]
MNFGSKKPRDIADELWEKCLANGCDVNQWEVDTHTLTGLGQSNDKIKATAHGNFAPEFRHALVWAMTELVGGTQEPYRWTEDRPPVSGGGKLGMDAFRGPKDYHINRFAWDDDHWESQSFISLSLERKEDGKAECESLFGVLEKVAGMLNGEVGSIVGSAKGACAAL